MNTIDSFHGTYRFLSNFWYVPIEYEGLTYPSTEHAFQAAKTTVEEFRIAVRDSGGPGDAKRMGRQVPMRPDWDKMKVAVMRNILRKKFEHPALRAQLLATGDAQLIEGNTWDDYFWGVCNGQGQNWLGELLMQIRFEIVMDMMP
jgi:ribA/ribD-fused uncharacterized protein